MSLVTKRKVAVAALSVVSNTVLVGLKLAVGLLSGSVSVLSEAVHSAMDLLAAIIALAAVRVSGRSPDNRHPYGHGKFENLSGTIEALLIMAAAIWITVEAIRKLRHPEPLESLGWGAGVMLLSVVANTLVSSALFRVGNATDSAALKADAWHLRTDVWTSFGVMLGLCVMWLGGKLFPAVDLLWVDPVCALAVALLIAKASVELTLEAGRDLLDVSLPKHEETALHEALATLISSPQGYHSLRTRKSGPQRFVELHLTVPPEASAAECHDIEQRVVEGLQATFPGTEVRVHLDPAGPPPNPAP